MDMVPIFLVFKTAAVKIKVKSGVVNMTREPGIGKNLLIKYKTLPKTYIKAMDIAMKVRSFILNFFIFSSYA